MPGAVPTIRPLLAIRGLQAGYGRSRVLSDIDLDLGTGRILGLLGRNGMGKTTLVRTVTGQLKPQAGSIRFADCPIAGLPPNRIARPGIAVVPEGRQGFPTLTVEEHLSAFQRPAADGSQRWTPARAFEWLPRLAERRRHLGDQLSGGEQQMLAIARALVTNPRLLILDEATEGLAPLVREEIWQLLGGLRQDGQSMIVIDKHVRRLSTLADDCALMEKGRLAWRGTPEALLSDPGLWRRYLGA